MIQFTITDSDMIILNSVESYIKSRNIPPYISPQEKLMVTQQSRDVLYSDIVRRVPRVAGYLLQADMETDTKAQGLNMSLERHALDPVFIDLLMQYLTRENDPDANTVTGAYLARVANRWIEQNVNKTTKTPPPPVPASKKGDKSTPPSATSESSNDSKDPIAPIKHILYAVECLLGNIMRIVSIKCTDLNEKQSMAIAACLGTNNKDTIRELISSDLPITADILDVYENPSNVIKASLLLDKTEIPTNLTKNQTAFVDSLKRWVYKRLNDLNTQAIFQFLVATYGFASGIDVSTKFINPKDCGTQYSQLLTVAKQMINNK